MTDSELDKLRQELDTLREDIQAALASGLPPDQRIIAVSKIVHRMADVHGRMAEALARQLHPGHGH